ncbi:MAG TPA: hypothetical protein PKY77_10145 [Phycisphaerae bacterium]|nr:hypothetical protein [Phycisphaerae bacterium]HRY69938.1 hypothetical protein [Phycisphaerae bacterium]HSA27147.1 hypothetical protein [Phycisphaerae bacterium]
MRSSLMLTVLAAVVFAAPLVSVAAPPAKPLPVTAKQFDQLRQIQAQPQHAAVVNVQATFTSDREKQLEANLIANDILTVAWNAGWPTTLLIVTICAAPL